MIALLCLRAALGQSYLAWPQIQASERGLLFTVVRRRGRQLVTTDAALAKIKVEGPNGLEKPTIGLIVTGLGILPGTASLTVDRSPNAGWRTITVQLSGLPRTTYPEGATTWLRYYLPAANTAEEVARLRSQWVGQSVWLLGSAAASRLEALLWDPRQPVKILDVMRVPGPVLDQCDNPVWNLANGWRGGSFFCATP